MEGKTAKLKKKSAMPQVGKMIMFRKVRIFPDAPTKGRRDDNLRIVLRRPILFEESRMEEKF